MPHVGTAYQALFDVAFAHQQGGQFILRLEDTDRARQIEGSEATIYEMLRWLKLDWDEGPDVGGPYGPYRQSERLSIYRDHIETLLAKGHAYRCWCTPERLARVREEQSQRKEPPRYDRCCLGKSEAERRREPECSDVPVVRLRMPDDGVTTFNDLVRGEISFENRLIDDQVLLKSDGFPTYHLAVVVDDHLMKISHVVRGEEWISSTPKHLVLYDYFGWEPPAIAHMSLLRNVDRSKISKRKHPWANLPWFRERGFLPEALVNFLGLMGFSVPDGSGGTKEVFSLDAFITAFDWSRVGSTAPAFDLEKLTWLNGVYVRALPVPELVERCRPLIAAAGLTPASDDYLTRVLTLEQERIHLLSDVGDLAGFFFRDDVTPTAESLVPKGMTAMSAADALDRAAALFDEMGFDREPAVLESRFRVLAEELGVKTGQLFGLIRVAITGTTKSPPLFHTAVTLGAARVRVRLTSAANALHAVS